MATIAIGGYALNAHAEHRYYIVLGFTSVGIA
jgi:hypothetical protein